MVGASLTALMLIVVLPSATSAFIPSFTLTAIERPVLSLSEVV